MVSVSSSSIFLGIGGKALNMGRIINHGLFISSLGVDRHTGKKSKITYDTYLNGMKVKYIESSSIVHYNKNHIVFQHKYITQELRNGHWHTSDIYKIYMSYQKISSNKIKKTTIWNGKKDPTEIIKTVHSPYYYLSKKQAKYWNTVDKGLIGPST